MAKKERPRYKRYTRPHGRNPDPRRWESASTRQYRAPRRKKLNVEFDTQKKPIIIMCVLFVLLVAYIVFGRPVISGYSRYYAYKTCRDRLFEVKQGMEKRRKDFSSHAQTDLYKYMDKRTNDHLESWVSKKCLSGDGRQWDIKANIGLRVNDDYIITGKSRADPPCLISISKDHMTPLRFEQCPQPPK